MYQRCQGSDVEVEKSRVRDMQIHYPGREALSLAFLHGLGEGITPSGHCLLTSNMKALEEMVLTALTFVMIYSCYDSLGTSFLTYDSAPNPGSTPDHLFFSPHVTHIFFRS